MNWEPPELTKEWEPPELQAPQSKPSTLTPFTNAVNSAIDTTPLFGLANQLRRVPEPVRRGVMEAGGMQAGALAGPAIATAMGAAPEAVIPAAAASVPLAGAGNAVMGAISDLSDHPEIIKKIIGTLTDPTQPTSVAISKQLLQSYSQDPDGAIQAMKNELSKTGTRFTTGAVAQLFSFLPMWLSPHVADAIRSGINPFDLTSGAIPGAKETADELGINLDPSQTTKNYVAKVLKNFANQGIFSANKMNAITEGNNIVLDSAMKDWTTQVSGGLTEGVPSSELAKAVSSPLRDLGEPLQKEIERRLYNSPELNGSIQMVPVERKVDSGLLDAQGKPLIKTVEEFEKQRTGGINIPISKWKDLATNNLVDILDSKGIINPDRLKTTLQEIVSMPSEVNFATAHFMRSELMSMARDTTSPNAARILNELVHGKSGVPGYGLSELMDESAQDLSSAALAQYKNANAFFKAGKKVFNNDLTAKLFMNDPNLADRVGRNLMSNGNVTQINQIKAVAQRIQELVQNPDNAADLARVISNNPAAANLLNESDIYEHTMNRVRRGTIQDILEPATSPDPNAPTPKVNYQGIMNDLKSTDAKAKMNALFTSQQLKDFNDIVETGWRANQAPDTGWNQAMKWGARVLGGAIIGAPMAAVGGATMGHFGAYAGFIGGELAGMIGEPELAAHLLTNPETSAMFVRGMKLAASKIPSIMKEGSNLVVQAAKTYIETKLEKPQ